MLDRIPRPVFVLALLALIALGFALGANAFVARKLSVSPERLAAARSGAPAPTQATEDPGGDSGTERAATTAVASGDSDRAASPSSRKLEFWMNPIVQRNLFDSANSLAGKKEEPKEVTDGEEATESEIAATLIATSVASDPIWSTALISTDDDGVNVYRIDEKLLDAIIKEIHRPSEEHPARVVLERNGSLEYLEAGEKKKTGRARKKNEDDKDTKKVASRSGRHNWGIEKSGENEYTVPQADVDYALGNLDKMAREARVVPNFSDGQTNGFKVFAIRRNSALRKMGLKNNDVLTSVNGYDLSNTEKALEIYGKLQSEKSFSLEILRNGEPVTLEYGIK